MDLVKFIKVMLRRKILLTAIPLFSISVAYLLLSHTPDSYKSKAQLATGITDEFKTRLEDSESRKPYAIENKFSNLIQLIKSNSVINLVSYSLILNDLSEKQHFRTDGPLLKELSEEEKNKIKVIYQAKFDSLNNLTAMDNTEQKLIKILEEQKYDYNNLIKDLKVYRLETSDFIEITFESENPNLSAFVVNSLSNQFVRYYKTISGEKSSNSVNFFAKLASQKKEELDRKVNELKKYKLNNGIINLYEQTEAIVDHIAKVEIMRETDNKKIIALENAIKKISEKLSDRDKQYIEADIGPLNEKISVMKEQINSIKDRVIQGEIEEAEASFLINPIKAKLNNEVFKLNDEMVIDPNVSMQMLVNKKLSYLLDLEITRESVNSIDKELERLYKVSANFAPSEALISSYEREITVAEEVYLLMLNKLNTATLNSLDLAGSLQQIERGEPADKPESSKKMLMIILAGVVSFVFTIVVIFTLEYLDKTLKSPLEFSHHVGLELLGSINRIEHNKINLSNIFDLGKVSTNVTVFGNLLRQLRFNIKSKMAEDKILLVTSTKKRTGKSFIISSLAYAFSRAGKRVLIVDSNFRNNTLTRLFNADPISWSFLNDLTNVDEIVQPTIISGIDIISCKLMEQSPFEYGGYDKFKKILLQLRPKYDYIFVEGPSLNKYSDAKEFFSSVDKIVTVFSAEHVIDNADKNSLESIKILPEMNIGGILNNISLENIDSVYGEVDFYRTRFRQTIKKYLSRNFGKSNKSEELIISK